MARMIQRNGKIYKETGDRMVQINGTIYKETSGAAPPAVTAIPPRLHNSDRQFATIIAHRLGGALQ